MIGCFLILCYYNIKNINLMKSFLRRFFFIVLALVLPSITLQAEAPAWWPFPKNAAPSKTTEVIVNQEPLKRETSLTTSFAPIIKKAAPSVVNIKTTTSVKVQNPRLSPLDDPRFRRFFSEPSPNAEENEEARPNRPAPSRKTTGLGSGVIMTKDGYILTNNHVISDVDEILIDIPSQNDKEYKARVVGTDPRSDLAVLKIEAIDLPAIVVGNSDQVQVGDVVLAIGNPFGLGQTVTQGIVSALGRNLRISRNDALEDFIQTDASINQGNSGGALIDAEGRLIGINTAILSPNGGNLGIGFAMPINMIRSAMEQIIQKGKVSRGYLGVMIQPLSAELAESFNLKSNKAALVTNVAADGSAKKAGILRGDVVIEINGKAVESADDLRAKIARDLPGNKVKLKIIRDGKPKDFEIILAELPEQYTLDKSTIEPELVEEQLDELFAGISVEDITPALRSKANLPPEIKGVFISEIDPTSLAAETNIRPGSVLVEVAMKEVKTVKEAKEAVKSAKGKVRLLVWNNGAFSYHVLPK